MWERLQKLNWCGIWAACRLLSSIAPQKYVTVHTAHGAVTLAFEDSAEAQLWFAALKDVVTTLKQVKLVLCCVTLQVTSVAVLPHMCARCWIV